MISLSRATLRAAVAVAAVLALAGCGSDSSNHPQAGSSRSPSPSASSTPTDDATTEPTDDPSEPASGSADGEVVKVTKYGISFEVPKGWITLDGKKVLKGGAGTTNSFLDDMAKRLGQTREQLLQLFQTYEQTMSVSDEGAQGGVLDNVNSGGQDGDLNDDQLRLQLATVGAKAGTPRHATSDAGDVTVISYTLTTPSAVRMHGVTLAVHTDVATVLIAVTSSSAERATHLSELVLGSLRKIPGTGPNA